MLRGLWTWFVLTLLTAMFGIPAILIGALRPHTDATMHLGRIWSRWMLLTVGARVRYEGLVDWGTAPRLFVSNHQSYVDIWALIPVVPISTRFVAKRELRRVPIVGRAMVNSDFVFIDRGNRSSAIESLRVAAAKVRAGRSLVLFGEGTRTRDGRLLPLKKGPFHLALEAGVPVVPVAISGSFDVLRPASLRVRPGPVRVRFLETIDVSSYRPADVEGLRNRVQAALQRELEGLTAAAP